MAGEDNAQLQMERVATHQCLGGDSGFDRIQTTAQGSKPYQQADPERGGQLGGLLRSFQGQVWQQKLNMPLRRMIALNLASKSLIISLWNFSKWNFADAASLRPER